MFFQSCKRAQSRQLQVTKLQHPGIALFLLLHVVTFLLPSTATAERFFTNEDLKRFQEERVVGQTPEPVPPKVIDEKAKKLAETLVVPNNRPIKVKSGFALAEGRWYRIVASGVVSNWAHTDEGIDAVWCYAQWRCGEQGEFWGQLLVDGMSIPEVLGQVVPYNADHAYELRIKGTGRYLEFSSAGAEGNWKNRSGAFTVRISEE